jgi:hypothetical protein
MNELLSFPLEHHDGPASHLIAQTGNAMTFSCLFNVIGAWKAGVHNAEPLAGPTFLYAEYQVLPVGIDHHVEVAIPEVSAMQKIGKRSGSRGKVYSTVCPIPLNILTPVAAPPY